VRSKRPRIVLWSYYKGRVPPFLHIGQALARELRAELLLTTWDTFDDLAPDFGPGDILLSDCAPVGFESAGALLVHIHHGVGASKNVTYGRPVRGCLEYVASPLAQEEAHRRGTDTSNMRAVGYYQLDALTREDQMHKVVMWNATPGREPRCARVARAIAEATAGELVLGSHEGRYCLDFNNPDIVVSENNVSIKGDALLVRIHHGVGSSKNTTFNPCTSDCLEYASSHFAVDEMERRCANTANVKPFGYHQLDGIRDLDPLQPRDTLLVLPTWNPEFNGMCKWVVDLCRSYHGKIVVQMHPFTPLHIAAPTCTALEGLDHVRLTDGHEDAVGLFQGTHALACDTGSAAFMYLPTGRPILAYNSWRWWHDCHPASEKGTHFDPEDLAFRWRDCMYQFTDARACLMLLRALDRGDDPLKNLRLTRSDALYGSTLDGRVCERIVADVVAVWRRRNAR